jgi:tRNA pseudouridine55 synthase
MNEIINLNKPSGITSRQAVSKVKRLLGARKAGHTGTLDPLATGVLLICLDEATKVSRFLLDLDKQYDFRVKLGERTDTYDSEGRVLEARDISHVTESGLLETVMKFRGRFKQKPPMYSAVKVKGRALYKLARSGFDVERPDRIVEVYDIKVKEVDLPYVELSVLCSKGTYIRTLCDDLGNRLGTGAHLFRLQRTSIGKFSIHDSVSFDGLLSGDKAFLSIDGALSFLKEIQLSSADYRRARNGVPIIFNKNKEFKENEFVRLKDHDGKLFGMGRINSATIRIERVLNL